MPSKKPSAKGAMSPSKSGSLKPEAEDQQTLAKLLGSMTIRLPSKVTALQSTDSGHMESKRIQTSQHRLGNNSRTFIEGMMHKTGMDTDAIKNFHSNSDPDENASNIEASRHANGSGDTEIPRSSEASKQTSRAITGQTTANKTTIFENEEDAKMASRQTRISTMTPSERKTQENWAQTMLKRTGCCPERYAWRRTRDDKGYQCEGLHHLITDNFLAKGHGGVWLLPSPRDTTIRWGPFHPHPKYKGTFMWGGKGRRERNCPIFIDEFGSCHVYEWLGRTQPFPKRKPTQKLQSFAPQSAVSQRSASQQGGSRYLGSQRAEFRGLISQGRESQGSQQAGSQIIGSQRGTGSGARSNRISNQR